MFARVGWVVTWLFAPLAGLVLVGLAIFVTLTGYDELVPAALMGFCALLFWVVLIWAVARELPVKRRPLYVGGCVALAAAALAASYLPQMTDEEASVTLILPPRNSQ